MNLTISLALLLEFPTIAMHLFNYVKMAEKFRKFSKQIHENVTFLAKQFVCFVETVE